MHTVSEIFVWPVSPTSSSLEHCTSLPKVCVGVKLKLEEGRTDGEGKLSGFRPVKYPCIHLPVTERERESEAFFSAAANKPTTRLSRSDPEWTRAHNTANESNGWKDGQSRGRGPFYIPGWPGSTWAANKRGIPTATGRGVDTCPLKERRDFRSAVNRRDSDTSILSV